jgi:hypothetical protein
MNFSSPSLHAPIPLSPGRQIAITQQHTATALIRSKGLPAAPSLNSVQIPLSTVSLNTSFDSYIDIRFKGSNSPVNLLLDSGNSVLIVPYWENIPSVPDYQVLGEGIEPWGCPAKIVRGPIELITTNGVTYTLENCVFYACTDAPPTGGDRTANFGAGCLSPWSASGWNTPAGIGVTMQAPLSYNSSYPFAEFNYAPAEQVFGAADTPTLTTTSSLILYKALPAGYTTFDIIPQLSWMALKAEGLYIGPTKTSWPGPVTSSIPIAMIDTGGGPVFLSDGDGYVCDKPWPDPVSNPAWTSDSTDCQSTSDEIAIELGDGTNSITYTINPSLLPSSVQGLTLVMCKVNEYMRGQRGMNIGGISALVNYILVDYQNARVGLKPKQASPSV